MWVLYTNAHKANFCLGGVSSAGRRAFKNISQKSVDPNVANKWKMLPKEAYHDHCAKAAQGSRDCPPRPPPPSLWLVGPPKTALLIYNNYLEDESIFLPRNEHDFFTAASTTSWGITKLRRELCQNALLPINKSKLSALFIIFFLRGDWTQNDENGCIVSNSYNECVLNIISVFHFSITGIQNYPTFAILMRYLVKDYAVVRSLKEKCGFSKISIEVIVLLFIILVM